VTGYQTTLEQIDRGFLPSAVGGSDATYITDYYYQNDDGWRVAALGGNAAVGGEAGFFYWVLSVSSSNDYVSIGGRITF